MGLLLGGGVPLPAMCGSTAGVCARTLPLAGKEKKEQRRARTRSGRGLGQAAHVLTVSQSGVPPQRHVQRRAAGTVTGCSTRRRLRPPPPSSVPPIRTSRRSSRSHGLPEFWAREPGFPTLVLLILEQQVSLASAKAAYDRLAARIGEVTPEGVLRSTDEELRADGFSRQKNRYVRALSRAIVERSLDLDAVACSTTTASARRSSRSPASARGRPRSISSRPSDDRTRGRSATSPSRRRPGAPAGSPSARHRRSSTGSARRGARTARAQRGSSGTSISASRGATRSA